MSFMTLLFVSFVCTGISDSVELLLLNILSSSQSQQMNSMDGFGGKLGKIYRAAFKGVYR